MRRKELQKVITCFCACLLIAATAFGQSTSWKGTNSTAWATAANWTNGVPTASLDAIIGDAGFTGANQPSISATAVAKSITIGNGAKASTLTITRALTVGNSVTIGANGTIAHNSTSTSFYLSVAGDFINNGTYSTVNSNATVIMAGAAQSIAGDNVTTFQCLTINSGSATTLGVNIILANVLNIAGSFDLSSYTANRSAPGGTISISNGCTLKIGGTNTFPSNYSSHSLGSTSTVEYSGTNQTVSNEIYGNLTLSSADGDAVKTMPSSPLTISGTLTSGMGSGTSVAFTAASTINISGSLVIGAATTFDASSYSHIIQGNFTNNGTFTCGTGTIILSGSSKALSGNTTFNNLTLSGSYTAQDDVAINGTMYLSGTYDAAGTTVDINGNLTLSGNINSSGIINFTGAQVQTLAINSGLTSTGTINFNGTVSPVINSQSTATFFNVNINNTAGITAASNWVVNGDCAIATGCSFDGGGSVLTFYGNFTNNGSFNSINTVQYLPASPVNIYFSGDSYTSSGTLILGGDGVITLQQTPGFLQDVNILNTNEAGITLPTSWEMEGSLYVDNNSILNLGTMLQHIVAGSVTNNGIINQPSGILSIEGDFNNYSAINSDTGTIVFNGAINQNITTSGAVFYNLAVNNAAGIMQYDDLNIANVLYLTSGIIYTNGFNTIVTNAADTAVQNYNSTSYVNGVLRRSIQGNELTYAFPVGDDSRYTLAELVNHSLSGIGYIDASFGPKPGSDGGLNVFDGALVYTNVKSTGVWYITPDAPIGGGSYDLKLHTNAFTGLVDNKFGILSRPDASTDAADWNVGGGTLGEDYGPGRNVADGYAVRYNLTSFSQKGIGVSGTLLPVTLTSFEAKKIETNALLNWQTAAEANSSHFIVEKAIQPTTGGNLIFKPIASVKAMGNSDVVTNYQFTDSTIKQNVTVYYRLKLFNTDSTFAYSDIRYLQFTGEVISISGVFPNPADNAISFELTNSEKSNSTICLMNPMGQIVQKQTNLLSAGTSRINLNLTGVPAGLYFISVTNNNNGTIQNTRFIKN